MVVVILDVVTPEKSTRPLKYLFGSTIISLQTSNCWLCTNKPFYSHASRITIIAVIIIETTIVSQNTISSVTSSTYIYVKFPTKSYIQPQNPFRIQSQIFASIFWSLHMTIGKRDSSHKKLGAQAPKQLSDFSNIANYQPSSVLPSTSQTAWNSKWLNI